MSATFGSSSMYDVAVVGGGLSGLTLAILLADAGVNVCCLDKDPPPAIEEETSDHRTTAISLGSKRILSAAGLWTSLQEHAEPILDIRVADRDSSLYVHYDHRDVGSEPFGWIVENRFLRRALFERASRLPSLNYKTGASIVTLDRSAHTATLKLGDGTSLQCRLVVGADGRRSLCRQSAGIKTWGWDYHQTSIVCIIRHDKPHYGIALERFLPGGPFAVLPMTDQRSSIVWTEHADSAPFFVQLPEDSFNQELRHRAGEWLGSVHVEGPRQAWPLSLTHASQYIDHRLALVGEAAHAIHPIAGQGLNMGLRDVAVLAEKVVDAWRLGLDVGGTKVLEGFQRMRRFDNVSLTLTTDGLNRLFSMSSPLVEQVRSLGLAAVHKFLPLKKILMRDAMGTLGHLPRLVQGGRL